MRTVWQCMAFHENKEIFWGKLCQNTMGRVTTEGEGVSEHAFSTSRNKCHASHLWDAVL